MPAFSTMTMSAMMVRLTSGSPAYPTSEQNGSSGVPMRSKPPLQNAETAWKMPMPMPRSKPNSPTKRTDSSAAPTPSNRNVPTSTRRISRTMPPFESRPKPAPMTMRSRSVMVRRTRSEAAVITDMKPRPPI